MARIGKLWPVLLSAVLIMLSYPPFDLWLLPLVSLVPWFWYLEDATRKAAFRSGYLLGFLVVLEQMSFVQQLVVRWTGSVGLSFVPWLACGFIGAFYFAFLGWLARRCMMRGWYWAIPITWAGVETMRSFVPALAYPWFLMATPLWHAPAVIQPAFFGTIYLVSSMSVLVNLLIVIAVRRISKRNAIGFSIALAVFVSLSLAMYAQPIEGRPKRILIGQTGVDMAFSDPDQIDTKVKMAVETLFAKERELHCQMLLLPEGLVQGGASIPPRTAFAIPPDQAVLFGGQRQESPTALPFQTAYAYDVTWSYADKTRLVVFGEYVPGRKWIPFLDKFNLPGGDLQPSDKVRSVHAAGMRIGPLLCFEGMFYDVSHKQSENGAQLLAIMSIDDWYMGTLAPQQLRTAAIWRAVETRLPLVRSASLGYSLAVDQRGRVFASAPLGNLQALPVTEMVEDQPARFRLRPAYPWLSSIFTIVLAVIFVVPLPRKRRSGHASSTEDMG